VLAVHLVMLGVVAICFGFFLMAGPMERALGRTGTLVITRLLGMLLAALSVQFVIDGVRKHPPVATQNRDAAIKRSRRAQRGDLVQAGPVLVLQAHEGRHIAHQARDHRNRHLHSGRQRKILHNDGRVASEVGCLTIVARNLVVGPQRTRRRDHHAGGPIIHHHRCQVVDLRKSWR
jgi:hypothetical protein